MLLIILLGAIARLAVVSADCNISTVNYYNTVWTNVSYSLTPPNVIDMKMWKWNQKPFVSVHLQISRTWYWLYHIPQNYNDNLDWPVMAYDPLSNNLGRITTSVYVKRWVYIRNSFIGYDYVLGFLT
jgi:hypothetical protein